MIIINGLSCRPFGNLCLVLIMPSTKDTPKQTVASQSNSRTSLKFIGSNDNNPWTLDVSTKFFDGKSRIKKRAKKNNAPERN